MKYIPHTKRDTEEMLQAIGLRSWEELYGDVPEELRLKGPLPIPSALSEMEVRQKIERLASLNRQLKCYAGAGAYDHFQPALVPYIASRQEFLTSYTPYQAEISQGTLQYIFEWQTMIARLTDMEVSNASMYDGATATSEAMLMCVAASKKRNRVLLSTGVNERVRQVVSTYAKWHGVEITEITTQGGETCRQEISKALDQGDVAGVIMQQPNRFGIVEDFTHLAEECHQSKSLLVINSPASVLAVLRSQGSWGADIAVGDAQSLGLPLNFGGPYIGYLATRKALVRKMPGRLVGETEDAMHRRCFVLTLQAREQHIRREKATSNICTAQGYMCLFAVMYAALLGKSGLEEVNHLGSSAAHYLRDCLLETGIFEEVYQKPFLNEFLIRYKGSEPLQALRRRLRQQGWLFGCVEDEEKGDLLLCCTEKQTKDDIDALVKAILNR